MAVEVAVALAAGFAAFNFALLAFGSDSIIELLSGTVVLLHLRRDGSGQDDMGQKTSHFSRLLLFMLIPVIAGGTVLSYYSGIKPESSIPGVVVALLAVIIMPYFWLEKRRIGSSTNCTPLKIDAVESATCFAMSIVLLVGLALQMLFNIYWIVYVATAVLLAFIAREALESRGNAAQKTGETLQP